MAINGDTLMHSDEFTRYVELAEDELMHRKHKYIYKEKIKGKWRYYYNKAKDLITGEKNMYDNINPRTYEEKRQQIMESQEWKDIVARRDPEYVRTDANGNDVYMIDDYMMNKKHPIVDGLVDFGMGRNVTITKQSPESIMAGFKDYVKMGKRSIENIMTVGVGLLTINLKNQQGSYEQKKKELRQKIDAGKQVVSDLLDSYSQIKSKSVSGDISKYASGATNQISDYVKRNGASIVSSFLKR